MSYFVSEHILRHKTIQQQFVIKSVPRNNNYLAKLDESEWMMKNILKGVFLSFLLIIDDVDCGCYNANPSWGSSYEGDGVENKI